jgi:hypothetical protein
MDTPTALDKLSKHKLRHFADIRSFVEYIPRDLEGNMLNYNPFAEDFCL